MDWLLNAFLSQSKLLRVPSTHQTILASARPVSSLYKRYKDPGAHPIPVHLMEAEFPNLNHQADRAEKRIASGNAAVRAYHSWIRTTWDLLFRSSGNDDPLDSLAEELGFDPTRAQEILARAMKIQNITAVRGKKSHPHRMKDLPIEKKNAGEDLCVPYLEIPRGKGDQEVIQEWEGRFIRIRDTQPELLRSVLGYYVNHAWKTSNVLLFHDPTKPEDAVRYLCLLKALGAEDNLLRLVFFKHQERKRSAFRRQWKNALKITWRWKGTIELRKGPFGESAASKRWLGIELSFGSKLQETRPKGADGFRFLMVMAAIAFGYAGDE